MKDFIQLSPRDRLDYFDVASNKTQLGVTILEKDFWVCWMIDKLFSIKPYLEEFVPDSIESNIQLQVLNVERTFWEKATILHRFFNYPENKAVPVRQSRHYYDFFCLLNSPAKKLAEDNVDLLTRVAKHNSIYFRAAWAKYEDAKQGTLKLIPGDRVLKQMENDYQSMREMFFVEPPKWDEILAAINNFEEQFNA